MLIQDSEIKTKKYQLFSYHMNPMFFIIDVMSSNIWGSEKRVEYYLPLWSIA